MDADRFDTVARSLVRPRSRRSVLARAAGSLAALGIAGAGLVAPAAAKRKCSSGETKCKKKCCREGEACVKGKCVTRDGDCASTAAACQSSTGAICHCRGNNAGLCHRRMSDDAIRCAIFLDASTCDQCANDQECLDLGFPPGSSCVQDYGPTCPLCSNNSLGSCVAPCGTQS